MKWLVSQHRAHPAATLVRLKPSVDISFTALLYFGATLFIGFAAMNSQTNLLFGVFGLMIGVLLVAGYISRFSLRRLSIHRVIPEHLAVAESSTVTYSVENLKRYWPSVSVAIGEVEGCEAFTRQPYAYLLHLAPGDTTLATVPLLPKRRGVHELQSYQLSTSFPFGFVKRAIVCRQKDTFVVFPALAKVNPAILSLCQSADNSGSQMRPRKGGNDEFYGVREYRPGENPRLVHWKLTARTGDLVMREMTHVSPPRLLLVVDTFRSTDDPDHVRHGEKAIAMAASLAWLALERGYPVGLLAWSETWRHIWPNRGKRHRRAVLTELARLKLNRERDSTALMSKATELAQAGVTVVLLTSGNNSSAPPVRRHGRVVVVSTRDQSMAGLFSFRDEAAFSHCMPLDQETSDFQESEPELFGSDEEPAHV